MLIVEKNKVNNLYVTVTELTTIDPAYYLMSLFSKDNHDTKVVRFTGNTSPNIERFDVFELTETTSANENLDNAWINLLSGGTYNYEIYQTSLSAGTSTSGLTVVESGLLVVPGDFSVATETYTQNNPIITFE